MINKFILLSSEETVTNDNFEIFSSLKTATNYILSSRKNDDQNAECPSDFTLNNLVRVLFESVKAGMHFKTRSSKLSQNLVLPNSLKTPTMYNYDKRR